MDHNYAIENHTAERYLLEELAEDERDAYEEHFFSCTACAEEVKAASEFIESARQVVQDEIKEEIYGKAVHHTSIWGSWLNWRSIMQPIPAMACVLLVFVSGFSAYQNRVTIPEWRQTASAQIISHDAIKVVLAKVHGEGGKVPSGKPLRLKFSIPTAVVPSSSFSSYQANIVNDSGTEKYSFNISQQQANDPVEIFLRAGALQPGKYFVVIRGISGGPGSGPKGEIERFSFELE